MTPPAAVGYGVSLGDTLDGILDILWEFYHTPKPRVIILRTERSLKCSKRRLACAVTQCHAINFPFVMQGCLNCQRELTQLQGARRLRHGCDHRYSWCSFHHAIN